MCPEASDVFPFGQLASASYVGNAVVVATIVACGDQAAGARVQITAVSEPAAVTDHKTAIGDVEDDLFGLRVIRVLDELEGHHVVALQACKMAPDVAEEIGGVGAAPTKLCCLLHGYCILFLGGHLRVLREMR